MKKWLTMLFLLFPCFAFCPPPDFNAVVNEIQKACDVEKIDIKWVMAVFLSEDIQLRNITHYCKKNKTWYYGAGEICLTTAQDMGFKGTRTQLKDYKVNIPLAVKYLASLWRDYDHDWVSAIQSYKTGSSFGEIYFDRVEAIHDKIL
jgi:hypothetical protein